MIHALFGNIRFYVLLVSFFWAIGILLYSLTTIHSEQLQIIRITQWFALSATFYLYAALFIGPLSRFVTNGFIQMWLKARRALGVSAFLFGLLHGCFAFFGQLGGFQGLLFLDKWYLLAISFSFTALLILAIMASTSFDFIIVKLKFRRWKIIHRFVYIAGIFILIHALMLGTHFQNLSSLFPVLFYLGLAVLLLMHGILADRLLARKWPDAKVHFGFMTIFAVGGLVFWFVRFIDNTGPLSESGSFNVHSQHMEIAKDAVRDTAQNSLPMSQSMPGMQGDRSKRYSVSFIPPENIAANKDVTLRFRVNDASSGDQVLYFQRVYEKIMHMIVVDSALQSFNHIHPEQDGEGFLIKTQFPKDGLYHIYLDFQPIGAIEQQFAFTVPVGKSDSPVFSENNQDTKLTKTFGNYLVNLSYSKPLISSQISVGKQQFKFTLHDSLSGKPVTNLKPYLAAFGHLVMINESTFEYIHVHPASLTAPLPDANGGPDVSFMPLGLYGPIKPGLYRVFAQFNPDYQLFTADFTVKVE